MSVSAIRSSSLISIHLVHDLRAAVVAVGFVDFAEFRRDYLLELLVAGQNFAQLSDEVADGLQFLQNFVDRELGQAMQFATRGMASICA